MRLPGVSAPALVSRSRRLYATTFDALHRYQDFRLLWAGNAFFFTGARIQALVMGWLVYDLTNSTVLLALYTAVNLLPLLLGPFGGVLSERMDRVKLIVTAQGVSILVSLCIITLALTDQLAYWHLVVAGFLYGATQAPLQPARSTLVMDMVSRTDLPNAMALNNISMNGTQAIGPVIGGLLLSRLGVAPALAVSALVSVVACLSIWRMAKRGARERISGMSPFNDLVQGFRILLTNRTILVVLSVTISANIFAWATYQTFMPIFAKDVLKVGADGLGALQTVFGVGSLLGAVMIAALGDFRWKGQLYVWGTACCGLFIGLFSLSHSFPLSLGLMFLLGIANSAFGVLQSTLLLLLAPPEMRGRVMGVLVLAIGILPFASFGLGLLASYIGVAATTTLCGFTLLLNMGAVFALSPSIRKLR